MRGLAENPIVLARIERRAEIDRDRVIAESVLGLVAGDPIQEGGE